MTAHPLCVVAVSVDGLTTAQPDQYAPFTPVPLDSKAMSVIDNPQSIVGVSRLSQRAGLTPFSNMLFFPFPEEIVIVSVDCLDFPGLFFRS